jgi:Icc-related predicted phosphoesterase
MTKLLAVSDFESQYIYQSIGGERFKDIDMIISCGDLPYYYLEYIVSLSNKDLYYVRGNHAPKMEIGDKRQTIAPQGAKDLHLKYYRTPQGISLAGIEGSLLYNNGPHQYSQSQMWQMVFKLVPHLLFNFTRYNRYLDIFVTHAPPWHINDQEDLPHQGIKAFRWLLEVFRPRYHLHGHTYDYLNKNGRITKFMDTEVINVSGYKIIEFQG